MRLKIRLRPSRNLGCIGIYTNTWAIDCFTRPYLGIFIRYGGWRTYRHLTDLLPLVLALVLMLALVRAGW